ncbi:prostaglandin E synthase 2 [Melanaphis sacchari]|uniref:Prostaglandin E synthase 2 n=1 Tax=Melanaphis sacchari TaxID=742174 RepID=A0A2H8TW55_9HEMI|nr:prostaglandin E synthase 2 [Melanaphis sacchari]XP_025196510.1 prostaglandin E synthase 2 [Melanaphis sacchari]
MALRVAVARLHIKTVAGRPFLLRINNPFNRMKHFNNESPLAKHARKRTSTARLIGGGVAIGVVIGAAYSYFSDSERKLPGSIVNTPKQIPILKTLPPELKVTRKVRHNNDEHADLILFQYPTCPFCCKVRAFLDYVKVPYDIIEVDPMLKQQISWSDYKKVPILLVKSSNGYQPLTDSTMIVSALATYLKDKTFSIEDIANFYPSISFVDVDGKRKTDIMNKYFIMNEDESEKSKRSNFENERKWRKWTDETLVHALSPNAYRTLSEAIDSFKWFSIVGEWEKNFPFWETIFMVYGGAFMMWIISKKLKKKYMLKDDVRQSLYEECNTWVKAVEQNGGTFMGGNKPNLADLAVYGTLSSIEGCMAFKDVQENTKINVWFSNMKKVIL